jgi:hypothetical protein
LTGQLQLKNVAAVIVTAKLPAFAQPGQVDVNVSSMGNAKSLKGGTLIATPLRGADGEIYALAQGNLVVGGAGAAGRQQGADQPPERRRIPQGAGGARGAHAAARGRQRHAGPERLDFQTAAAWRRPSTPAWARAGQALDGRTVQVRAPNDPGARVNFIAEMEELPIETMVPAAKVVINARTGSIVLNQAVTWGPAPLRTATCPSPSAARRSSASPHRSRRARPWWRRKRHPDQAGARQHHPHASFAAAGRRGARAQRAGRHAAGPAGHPAGHQGRRRAERGAGGDLSMAFPFPLAPLHAARAGGDVQSLNASSGAGENDPAAAKEAAKQLESLFMREMIKSMREATMKSGLLDSAQGDLGTDMLDQQLSVQMSGQPGGCPSHRASWRSHGRGRAASPLPSTLSLPC